MIIHYKDNFDKYQLITRKPLKYSDSFTFIPIQIFHKNNKKYHQCILQTPYLFSPYGIQTIQNNKKIIDLSFLNKDNDIYTQSFLKILKSIYKNISKKYSTYDVQNFLKNTLFDECMRLKVDKVLLFNQEKDPLTTIESFSYGSYLIHLYGLWISDNKIWIQWYLIQAKIVKPIYFQEYSLIDEEKTNNENKIENKYDKMLKMGVPKEAVEKQKLLDGFTLHSNIPPPPILNKSISIPKINASDLQNVVLKKSKPQLKKQMEKQIGLFEPPSLEELQTTLSKLKKIN
jgi:hypothetical protein